MDEMWHDFEYRKNNLGEEEFERRRGKKETSGGGSKKRDYEIETRVSDCEKKVEKRKLMTNCKCSFAALTDRPIILLAHLEAMPG